MSWNLWDWDIAWYCSDSSLPSCSNPARNIEGARALPFPWHLQSGNDGSTKLPKKVLCNTSQNGCVCGLICRLNKTAVALHLRFAPARNSSCCHRSVAAAQKQRAASLLTAPWQLEMVKICGILERSLKFLWWNPSASRPLKRNQEYTLDWNWSPCWFYGFSTSPINLFLDWVHFLDSL